jgi:hypothetical protein
MIISAWTNFFHFLSPFFWVLFRRPINHPSNLMNLENFVDSITSGQKARELGLSPALRR